MMKRAARLLLLPVLGLLASALVYGGPSLRLTFAGVSDFISFYSGGKLAGTPDLYNPARVMEVQTDAVGWSNPQRPFIRLPYYSLFLWPISRLPYLPAYCVWQALAAGAVAFFVWLWPCTDRRTTALACCWSFPLFSAFAQGQDIAFVIVAIALAVRLQRKQQPFLAGLAFALCAAKFHIFLLVPLWIAAQRLWKFGQGFAAGAAILTALSFAAGGWNWPVRYAAMLRGPNTSPAAEVMPNLHSVFSSLQNGRALEIASALCIAALTFSSLRRLGFEHGLALTTGAGLLISHHSYIADCALLLPGILFVWSKAKTAPERFTAMLLFTPLAYAGAMAGSALTMLTRIILLSYVVLLTWIACRRPGTSQTPQTQPARS